MSTPTGARGTETVDDVHAALADPGDFPAAVRWVLEDDGTGMSRAARRLAEECYDWPELGSSFLTAVRAALPELA